MMLLPALNFITLEWFHDALFRGTLSSSLHGMQIDTIGICTESESSSDIVITEMIFEDAGEEYDLEQILPYVTNIDECEVS